MGKALHNTSAIIKLIYISAVILLIGVSLNLIGVIPVIGGLAGKSGVILCAFGFSLMLVGFGRWGKAVSDNNALTLMQVRVSLLTLILGYAAGAKFIILLGYIFMYIYFSCFKRASFLNEEMMAGCKKVRLGALLALIAAAIGVLGAIPALGLIFNLTSAIIYVIAFAIYLLGWSAVAKAPLRE